MHGLVLYSQPLLMFHVHSLSAVSDCCRLSDIQHSTLFFCFNYATLCIFLRRYQLQHISQIISNVRHFKYIYQHIKFSLDLQKCTYIMFQVFALLNKLTVIATCLFRDIHFDMQIIHFVNSQKPVNYVVSCTV